LVACKGAQAMSTYPPPGSGQVLAAFGRRIEEAVELIEMELRHTIAYVNDAVIPQVRRESISALRTVADTLRNLADRVGKRRRTDRPQVRSGRVSRQIRLRIREPDDRSHCIEERPASCRAWACGACNCRLQSHKNVARAPSPNELAPYVKPTYVPALQPQQTARIPVTPAPPGG